jgi:methylglyoxal synthase
MTAKKTPPIRVRKIALVAHDNKKSDLVEWARFNRETLAKHALFATGTTGRILEEELGLTIKRLQSGPIGGDQQVGALIANGEIDFLIFFWDPLAAQPHDPDVKALLRLTVVWNIPAACNRATADYLISSPLMSSDYQRAVPDYANYLGRTVPASPALDAGPAGVAPGETKAADAPKAGEAQPA